MAVSVRFHRRTPGSGSGSLSAAMPDTPLSMITTGMRFISWVPAAEDLIGSRSASVVRNGIRRFQIADPSNDPERLKRLAAIGAGRRMRGDRDRPHVLDQRGPHARVLRRAGRGARPTAPTWTACTSRTRGGLLTPDAVRELAPPLHRRRARASGRSFTATARSAWPRSSTSRASVPGFGSSTPPSGPLSRGHLAARGAEYRPQPRGGRASSHRSRPRRRGGGVGVLRPSSPRAKACPPGRRRSSMPPTTSHQLPGGMVTHDHVGCSTELRRGGAVRRGAPGGAARPRRDGLPDHRDARLAADRHSGGAAT